MRSKLIELLDTEMLTNNESNSSSEVGWLEGRYTNYFKVGHNAFEFLLDFGQFYPEDEKAQLHTRIITSPSYAKALLETLQKSIDRFELTFGAIHAE
jgi:hypothetical protein